MQTAMAAIDSTSNRRVLVIFPGALGDLLGLVPAAWRDRGRERPRGPRTRRREGGDVRALAEIEAARLESRIDLIPRDVEPAEYTLRQLTLLPHGFILILPGSGSPTKNWPAANFAALAERIAVPSLVLLGPAEAGLKSFFEARNLAVVSDLELDDVAGLAHLSRCFLGNDSGVSHLASASGARGLVLFGRTDPTRWRPLGDVKAIPRVPPHSLPVADVVAALEQLLGEPRTP